MNWVIVREAVVSMREKRVLIYLEDAGVYRQIEDLAPADLDLGGYVQANFAALWAEASVLAEDAWTAAQEQAFGDLYAAVVRAGIRAARVQNATLADVSAVMEAVIGASGKSSAYNRLASLASAATATERNRFMLILAFVSLGNIAE